MWVFIWVFWWFHPRGLAMGPSVGLGLRHTVEAKKLEHHYPHALKLK